MATLFEQPLLDLGPAVSSAGMLFRVSVTTDIDGALFGASFVVLRNDQPKLVWPLPLAEAEPLIVLLDDARANGPELPPPSVGDHRDDEDERGEIGSPSDDARAWQRGAARRAMARWIGRDFSWRQTAIGATACGRVTR